MLRLILPLWLFAVPAWADALPAVAPLHPSPSYVPSGPGIARGALVWLHGAYDSNASPPPIEPNWVTRMAHRDFDIWRFDRLRGQDPLGPGGEALVRGLQALRAAGYAQITVAGYSRGGWIGLTAMTHTGAADSIVALSPAAHGTRAERQGQALVEWQALWEAAQAGTRVALVQLADDPYDPEPARRLSIAAAGAARAGIPLLSIFLPDTPRGHEGTYDPTFDARFGETIADFVDQPGSSP